jgi:hypothetical protein
MTNLEEYIKQLETSNYILQQKLDDVSLKFERSSIREKVLEKTQQRRMWTLNGYKDIKTAKEYSSYKNKPYPQNCRYPDYMYWTTDAGYWNQRSSSFCYHFIQQIRDYVGLFPEPTYCSEEWLDEKIKDMSILILNWYRPLVFNQYTTIKEGTIKEGSSSIRRSYIIERGNPEIYYIKGKGGGIGTSIIPVMRLR